MENHYFVEYYNDNKSNKYERNMATTRLVKDLLIDNKVGNDKIVDLDDTDLESQMPEGFGFPGMIYTFIHKGGTSKQGKITFTDYMPILLCCECGNESIAGVNFNYLPPEYRAMLLDTINEFTGNYYTEKGLYAAQCGDYAMNTDFFKTMMIPDARKDFFAYYYTKTHCDLMKAYRRYYFSNIESFRLVEYPLYKYITIIASNDAIKGADILKVQKETIAK